MIRRMEIGVLQQLTTSRNAFNEVITDWVAQEEPIEVAVSVRTGNTGTVNNVVSVQSTHIGLTKDTRAKPQDKIDIGGSTYKVDYVIPSHRMNQLMLTQEESVV